MNFPTDPLRKLVHPEKLGDVLRDLKRRGVIGSYKVGEKVTEIEISKNLEIVEVLKEEMKPRPNPRPQVRNK